MDIDSIFWAILMLWVLDWLCLDEAVSRRLKDLLNRSKKERELKERGLQLEEEKTRKIGLLCDHLERVEKKLDEKRLSARIEREVERATDEVREELTGLVEEERRDH